MSEYFVIFIRSISSFILLLIITRLIGKQTLSNMNSHDFVTAIILGAIAANIAFNEKIVLSHLVISLGVFTVTSWLLSLLSLKGRNVERWLFGKPSVVVDGGVLLQENMKKNKLTLDSLNEMLREKEIFDIAEVEYALLENSGKLSVLRKKEYRHLNLHLLNVEKAYPPKPINVPVELIKEGKFIYEHLHEANIKTEMIEKAVQKKGHILADVFYAVKGTDGKLYFDFYQDQLDRPKDM
ncbi:YetF domain-containing protein [Paenibacillus sp. ATY16]|uniref:DUF421 domain-containing protein n=1 Tax=Paenibacillus sp. ATY16 TaxID=1759312 RepID=UPI00200C0F0B|nr:YetF domain-containing protein [Paenibacillus sp. ATY16]MCK9862933.1 DUF421 domain-containing protein [Paenibacillus sp. ATY16]